MNPTQKLLKTAILPILIFLLPVAARAEILGKTTEVGVLAGYHFFQDSQNLKNRPVFGARIGYNFSKNFGLEGSMEMVGSRVQNKALFFSKEGQFRSPMDKVDLNFYRLDGIFYLRPQKKANPFISAGIGRTHYEPTISTDDMLTLNLGVGTKLWIQSDLALRVDLRDLLVGEGFQESFHNIQATVGLSFSFGPRSKPKPVAASKHKANPKAKAKAKKSSHK